MYARIKDNTNKGLNEQRPQQQPLRRLFLAFLAAAMSPGEIRYDVFVVVWNDLEERAEVGAAGRKGCGVVNQRKCGGSLR